MSIKGIGCFTFAVCDFFVILSLLHLLYASFWFGIELYVRIVHLQFRQFEMLIDLFRFCTRLVRCWFSRLWKIWYKQTFQDKILYKQTFQDKILYKQTFQDKILYKQTFYHNLVQVDILGQYLVQVDSLGQDLVQVDILGQDIVHVDILGQEVCLFIQHTGTQQH